MKKGLNVRTLVFMVIILCCTSFISSKKVVNADESSSAVPLQIVEDIDNFPYPTTSLIHFQASNFRYYTEFTISSPGQVKALLRFGVSSEGIGSAWISRDSNGNDIVGNISELVSSNSDISWFLESGKYYFNCKWNAWNPQARLALLYENSKTEETCSVSDFTNTNSITPDSTVKGFISTTIPNDYYSFVLTKKANVTFEYSFDASNNTSGNTGYCTLYNSKEVYLKDGTYSSSDRGTNKFVYLLEPGTYYIKLNGLYGNTTLSINPMYYDIKLTPAVKKGWTKKSMDIDIKTSIDYSEIIVLNKDVEESVIKNNNVWTINSKWNINVDGETFKVTKNGIYSVRITDKYGNYAMQKIKVTTMDVTKPKITGVANKKAYNKAVTIKWLDKQSGIDSSKTTLNGNKVSSGVKVTKQGKYTLKVYDKVGNVTKIIFYLDYTAPTAGVENGKTYDSMVTLKFLDNLSGIKKIVVDDIEEPIDNTNMSCYLDGKYTVKLWDNAGNYSKTVFYIKQSY